LSGAATAKFAATIQQTQCKSRIITTLHYAHRKGAAVERDEIVRVRSLLADASART
jgi:hypothetical protein